MAQLRTSRTFDVILVLALVAVVWWAAGHRAAVGDWVYFLNYHPTPEVTQVAEEAHLSLAGRQLLYRTNPQFADKATVAAACDIERLGCIDEQGRVFILDTPGQHDQAVVTAAHEMLHLAYRRLSPAKQAELAPLIDAAMAQNTGPDLAYELRSETTPEGRRDEAHSLLGTEFRDLPPALEQYYAQYFTDRVAVLALADKSRPQ